MTSQVATPVIRLAFLTVVPASPNGFMGGLLVLNQRARPLEFHCTAPVQPSRGVELLYGKTFRPYLFGEQIAATLLQRSRMQASVCLTDTFEVLSAREIWSGPVLYLKPEPHVCSETCTVSGGARGADDGSDLELLELELRGNICSVLASHAEDYEQARQVLETCSRFDLLEPFQRLREAMEETQRSQAA